jgi:hypothetical protein
MAKVSDLYPILKAYAAKNNSPYIEIESFLDFLEKYSGRKVQEQPEWGKWQANTEAQFWNELSGLVENDSCVLMEDSSGGRVYMPFFYVDMLRDIYRDLDKDADMPFPSEESLGITIPEHQLKIINLKADLEYYIRETKEEEEKTEPEASGQIIKLIFPDDNPSALLLISMIPRRLTEAAFLKIRHYLRGRGNKEFILHKLSPQLQGREKYLREILERLMIRPMDCLNEMEKAGDFSYIFWTYFCSLVKTDINKRNELLSENTAAIQAALIIEICNGLYRTLAVKKRERELAFRILESHMGKQPWYFTKEEVFKFNNDKGVMLLGMYSQDELENYIKEKTGGKNNELPEWLILKGVEGRQWYIKKEKYLSLCGRMLIIACPLVKKAISKRWTKLLREYSSEPSMEKDPDFEKLLASCTKEYDPTLAAMLEDRKLLWVSEETESLQDVPPQLRFFKSGKLLPLSVLYGIRRKDILTDTKMLLPFWYSTPILTAIIAFFRKLAGKKKRQPVEAETEMEEGTKDAGEIHNIAESIMETLVPVGQTLDNYLEELESRWNKLLDAQFRQNLNDDIQALVRDNMRKIIRIHKSKKLPRKSLDEITNRLISSTPALHSLSSQDSLHLYIELLMVKMMLTIK